MVKVTFRPWEEVIIHESIQYTLNELIHLVSLGVQPGALAPPLNWAEGVVFIQGTMPPTEDVIRENLKGIMHWNVVRWALMPNFQNIVVVKETNVRIPIVDVRANEILSEVAKSLRKIAKQK